MPKKNVCRVLGFILLTSWCGALDGYDDSAQNFEDLNIPDGWSVDKAVNERSPRTCDPAAEFICEQEYMSCQLYAAPANDPESRCVCAGQFYGICLREAGCAAHRFTDCVQEHMGNDCSDMSVCGSNCVGATGNDLDLSSARILPVNNYAKNFLRFSTCPLGLDQETFASFGVARMRRCRDAGPGVPLEEEFKICPYWVPPSVFTALAIPADSAYVRMEYANYVDSSAVSGGGAEGNATRSGAPFIANVLKTPGAVEIYGTKQLWPSTIDVGFEETNFCTSNSECPGSYCNMRPVPHKCAPKTAKHHAGSGYGFKEHSFTDGKGGDTQIPRRDSSGSGRWGGVGGT
mmetsp:Transcript_33737/g.56718  ORF Transcript_33737/g.56718 Transcript_33737/m.56718 type:complete len:346 (-) Transcript_33737:117-1154(-)